MKVFCDHFNKNYYIVDYINDEIECLTYFKDIGCTKFLYKRWVKIKTFSNHRLDGPAVIGHDYKYFYKNGELHREDGPAIITKNFNRYFFNGKEFNSLKEILLYKILY